MSEAFTLSSTLCEWNMNGLENAFHVQFEWSEGSHKMKKKENEKKKESQREKSIVHDDGNITKCLV